MTCPLLLLCHVTIAQLHQYICLNVSDLPSPSPSVLPPQPVASQSQQPKPVEVPVAVPAALPYKSIIAPIGQPTAMPPDTDEDEGLKHFEQVGQGGIKAELYLFPSVSLSQNTNIFCAFVHKNVNDSFK